MTFEFNNFKVFIERKKEELDDLTTIPRKLTYNKTKVEEYQLVHKTREFIIFAGLNFLEENEDKYYKVISNLFVFIDLIEVLKAYSSKRLEDAKEYEFEGFTAKIATKNEVKKLRISFQNFKNNLFLDKFECASLAAKFSKILSRCEAWQE